MTFVKLVLAIFLALSLFSLVAIFLLSWRISYEEREHRRVQRERGRREHVD